MELPDPSFLYISCNCWNKLLRKLTIKQFAGGKYHITTNAHLNIVALSVVSNSPALVSRDSVHLWPSVIRKLDTSRKLLSQKEVLRGFSKLKVSFFITSEILKAKDKKAVDKKAKTKRLIAELVTV